MPGKTNTYGLLIILNKQTKTKLNFGGWVGVEDYEEGFEDAGRRKRRKRRGRKSEETVKYRDETICRLRFVITKTKSFLTFHLFGFQPGTEDRNH